MISTWTWNAAALAIGTLVVLAAWARRPRLALAGILVVFAAHVVHRDLVVDDTFITLRYAHHWATGVGPVFNPGERVEGFTSPLWLAWLALAERIGCNTLLAARLGGIAAAAALLFALARWSQRLHPTAPLHGCIAPLLVALHPSFATWAGAGLETPLFALVVFAATAAFAQRRVRRASAFSVVAVLVRPEAMLLPALLFAGAWFAARRRPALRTAAALVLPAALAYGAVLLVRHAYFGTWLPNTYHAKVGFDLAALGAGCEYVGRFLVLHGGALWMLALAPLLARRGHWEIPATVVLGFTAVTVLLGGDGLPAFRFLVPVLALAALLLQEGVLLAVAHRRGLAQVMAIAGAAFALQIANAYPSWAHDRQVMRDFVAIGRWIGPRLGPDDCIAVSAVGAIGHATTARIVDRLGLTDAHVARTAPQSAAAGHRKHDAAYVLAQRPSLVTVDWNGLYAEPPPADPKALRAWLELRFDGADLYDAPAFVRDYEVQWAEVRPGGFWVYFVRRELAAELAVTR